MAAFWLEELRVGALCCIRGRIVGESMTVDRGHILVTPRGWHIHVPLGHEKELVVGSNMTIFNAKVVSIDANIAVLEPLCDFQAIEHTGEILPNHAVELCCGLGGLSVGANAAGLQVTAGMDVSQWALKVFHANHRAMPIEGSICDPNAVARLFQLTGRHSCGYLTGFPCPPFSSMGDQRGFADSRSQVFVAGLDVVYLLGGLFIILECTQHVESFPGFKERLDSFAKVMGFGWISRVLRLDNCWPTFRTRWWAIVAPRSLMDFVTIDDMPCAPHLKTVRDLIPLWPRWSPEEEELLRLTEEELDFYEQFAIPHDLLLNMSGKCATLLHSLGHLDRACPCSCRSSGLSPVRLRRDGISAVFVRCSHSSGLRHLHAAEAGFFCTLPPSFRYLDVRKALPLIGQTAAPLQAQWIVLALRRALDQQQGLPATHWVDSFQSHVQFQDQLQHLAMNLWPTQLTAEPRLVKLRCEGSCTLAIQVEPHATIEDLITAQKALGGWGARVLVTCQNQQLPHQAILRAITYDVKCYEPKQLMAPPAQKFVYALFFEDRVWVGILAPGTLLGVLLMQLGFSYTPGTRVLSNGHCWNWGDLLWNTFSGELIRPIILGAGPSRDKGISNLQLDSEAHALCRSRLPTGFCLLSSMDLTLLLELPPAVARCALLRLIPADALKIFGFFCHEGHWAAFSYDRTTMVGTYYDGIPSFAADQARFCLEVIAAKFDDRFLVFRELSLIRQIDGSHCGVIALVHFGHFLGLWTSFAEQDALDWHRRIQSRVIFGAGAADYTRALDLLTQELPKHGVPPTAAHTRAALALKKLGAAPILKAFSSRNPWQSLKALGSSNERPFQWVQHDELEVHVAARAADKTGPMTKQRTKKQQAPKPNSVALTPNQVQVPPNAFCDPDGKHLPALTFECISATARGVVVVTVDQAVRFLQDAKTISVDCLALLTLTEVPLPPDCKLDAKPLTWPGLHIDTQAPLLIRGTCLQLGDIAAKPCHGKIVAPSVDTDLLRLTLYKDQCWTAWDRIVAGPLKAIIQHFAPFQFCAQTCDATCTKFHASVEEEGISLVVLDAFAWRWTDGNKTLPAQKASTFSVMVRVPKSGTDAILHLSGLDGLYAELRADDQVGTHNKFAVVWLRDGFEEARHKLQSITHALHLVRLNAKYGLRCLRAHEAEIHQSVFPDRHFIACGVGLQFEMGPWPFGITRQAICEFLKAMPWTAKPLRPVKGGNQGRYWLIGSEHEPPATVVAHTEAFLTITQVKQLQTQKPQPNIVASMKTLRRIQNGSVDPWAQPGAADPWGGWKGPGPAPSAPVAAASSAASSKLEELEHRLGAKLSEQLHEQFQAMASPDAPMEEEQQDSRLNQLESSLRKFVRSRLSSSLGVVKRMTR